MRLKKKALRTLLTLVLVLSLSLAISIPAEAENEWWNPDPPVVFAISGWPTNLSSTGQAITGQGWDWDSIEEKGEEVELFINGISMGTTEAKPNAEDNGTPFFFDVVFESGDKVELVGANHPGYTAEIIITDFTTFVNVYDDKVYGKSESNANMVVSVPFGSNDPPEQVTADANGFWAIDFESVYEIEPGTYGATGQYDEEGDTTLIIWEATEASNLAPVSTLANTYGGLKQAANDLNFDSVKELHEAIFTLYSGE